MGFDAFRRLQTLCILYLLRLVHWWWHSSMPLAYSCLSDSGAFNFSWCFSKLNCRVGWPSIEKWRTRFSSNLELWDEIESYKRWSTSLCRAQNKATQWLNLVDFFAIAPYYVSLRCLAQQVFSWYASRSCYLDVDRWKCCGAVYLWPLTMAISTFVREVAGVSIIRWSISRKYRCFKSPAFGESVSWPGMPEGWGEFSKRGCMIHCRLGGSRICFARFRLLKSPKLRDGEAPDFESVFCGHREKS